MPDFDAIVIGSGAGGLSAALRLSQLSSSVLLLEAMPSFGGYLNPFSRNGYLFDTGVHYLGKLAQGQSFQLLLQLLGLDVSFVELNPDGFDRYIFPDFELRMCKGRERFQDRLHRLFPDETKAIKRYFQYSRLIFSRDFQHQGAAQEYVRQNHVCGTQSGDGEVLPFHLSADAQFSDPEPATAGGPVGPLRQQRFAP